MSQEDDRHQLEEQARRGLRRLHADAFRGPRPGAEDRILAGLDYGARGGPRRPWLAAAAAVLLAAVIVTSLLSTRFQTHHGSPAATPPATEAPMPPTALPCRLPIDRAGTGAFLTIPAQGGPTGSAPYVQPSADPAGHPRLPDGEDPVDVTYSWELSRWLPVRGEQVAADGVRYAFSDRVGALHVVDARSGRDRRLNGDRTWAVIAFQKAGIYAAPLIGLKATGLWLIDPATGAARQLRTDGAWQYVTANSAWELTSTPPARPVPTWSSGRAGLYGNTLVRLDLASGRLTTMYARTDTELHLIGVDAEGDPAMEDLAYGVSPLILVTGPGRAVTAGSGVWTGATIDGDRTWFGEIYGPTVWLKDAAGIRAVAAPGGGQVRVAGACH